MPFLPHTANRDYNRIVDRIEAVIDNYGLINTVTLELDVQFIRHRPRLVDNVRSIKISLKIAQPELPWPNPLVPFSQLQT
jgi:hypothetical protein